MFKSLLFLLLAINLAHLLPTSPLDYVKPNTPENIEKLKTLGPGDHPELYSGQYEGDMVLLPEQLDELKNGKRDGRTGVRDTRYRWTYFTIPFRISNHFTQSQVNAIYQAADYINANTCIWVRDYDPIYDSNWVQVTGDQSGCWSYVGMIGGGAQALNLGPGCFGVFTIVHEFLHAAGFHHMHSNYMRDTYVNILWQNIQPEYHYAFDIMSESAIDNYGLGYDYGSVMHYHPYSFSSNGQPTITARQALPPGVIMGQSNEMSQMDRERVNRMYNYCPW